MQWFYFKVTNSPKCQAKTVKFKICNNRKEFTLFKRGMKPFIHSKILKKTKGLGWHQAGFHVSYNKLSNESVFLKDIINNRTGSNFTPEEL